MSVSVFKTFSAAEVLTAADLNSSLTQITNNGTDVAFPLTKNVSAGGFVISSAGLGTVSTDVATVTNCNTAMCEFRLTLTSSEPSGVTDVSTANTIYWAPYKGNRVALFDGTYWHMRTSNGLSIATPAGAATLYDMWVYDNAGTPSLETTAWSSDTARVVALTLQDGVLVKTGLATRRYVGTFRTISASQCTDSIAFRHLYNYYNRLRRPMRVTEATDTWNYTTATIRQARATATNQLDFVNGYNEDMVSAEIQAFANNDTGGVGVAVGIGLDSTSTFTTGGLYYGGFASPLGVTNAVFASWKGFPGVGRHYLSWNEYSAATGTTTWYGDGGAPAILQAGIHGELMG